MDYRKLNAVAIKDAYPLPRIDGTLLSGSKWFSTLDLLSGYWQVEMSQRDSHKTAFGTPQDLFEFKVMPFALCNAPATFQRLMDLVRGGYRNFKIEGGGALCDKVIVGLGGGCGRGMCPLPRKARKLFEYIYINKA